MDSIRNYYPLYQFIYAAFSYNQMPGSQAYMISKYNFYYVPTTYFDGGISTAIGGDSATSFYRPKIQAAGSRATHDLYLSVSLDYISSTELQIHYEVADRTFENQAPSVASSPTTDCVMISSSTSAAFTTQATDPDGDQLYYRWAFGNGDSSTWKGPYNSGDTCMVNYAYPVTGNYDVNVLTSDSWLTGTVWSSPLTVKVTDCECGDANGDAGVDISDAVFLISYIFSGGQTPGACACSGIGNALGDANGDSGVDISDAVYLISYIFSGGSFPHCP
ncbi:MAG: PKD domain-containing protein [Candidatus Zixiibacteriota bacterium]|nr:MAG: PKD domain-containing protein [candidate division Zixibacteria bacterium]